MELLFIKIILSSCVFGSVYVDILTANRGLLDSIPQYYPKILQRPLECNMCVSGWIGLFFSTFFYIEEYGLYNISIYFYIINTPLFCIFIMNQFNKHLNN